MLLILIIIGAIVGAAILGEQGILLGAAIGYLFAKNIQLERTVRELRQLVVTSHAGNIKKEESAPSPSKATTTASVKSSAPAAITPPVTTTDTPVVTNTTESPISVSLATTSEVKAVSTNATALENNWTSEAGQSQKEVQSPQWWEYIKEFFTSGNTLVRVGIIILFFGMAFLAKYAAERGIIPIEVRMVGIAFIGLALIVLGWKLRLKRTGYALALQGGGIGITYLTIFASMRLYHILPPTFAFTLMILVCLFSAAMAILGDSLSLAVLGSSFGFLAPVLTSTGGGSHVLLFSYYTLLNFGILAIAWYKTWRPLNLTGFIFTFVIGSVWGAEYYRPELFATTEPFLIGFFLFYVTLSILYAIRQPINLRGYIDGTLVFGTPIIGFGLQYALVRNIHYGLTYSALALCTFYILLAYAIFKFVAGYNRKDGLRLICECFLSIGVVFGTVAIPLALDDQWTAAAWALEGAALVYVGIRQKRDLAYFSGLLLQVFAAGYVLKTMIFATHATHWAFINGPYVNGLLMSIAGFISAYFSYAHHERIKRYIPSTEKIVLGWGVLWWVFSGFYEIYHHSEPREFFQWVLVLGIVTVIVARKLRTALSWKHLVVIDHSLIVFMLLVLLTCPLLLNHPFRGWTGLAWVMALVTHFALLRSENETPLTKIHQILHGSGTWILTLLLIWEGHWWINQWLTPGAVWPYAYVILVPILVLAGINRLSKTHYWPFSVYSEVYLGLISTPLSIAITLLILFGIGFNNANPAPLPYIPVFNPLNMVSLFGIVVLLTWWLQCIRTNNPLISAVSSTVVYSLVGAILFLMANATVIKTIHYWYQVPLTVNAMLESDIAQTTITILWSVIAMVGMIASSRRGWRRIWLCGAGLLAAVVIKLFFIDLSNVGTVERIISFIVVGVLMLIIGYLTPLPPRAQEKPNA